MSDLSKRATVYLEPAIHKALQFKSLETSLSISQLINDALRAELLEDANDFKSYEDRINEPSIDYQTFVQGLKKDGIL